MVYVGECLFKCGTSIVIVNRMSYMLKIDPKPLRFAGKTNEVLALLTEFSSYYIIDVRREGVR